MSHHIVTLPGDGIGPEIMAPTLQLLRAVGEFEFEEHLFGGASIDAYGIALTDEVLEDCRKADAVTDRLSEQAASPAAILARLQDIFRAELDNDDLVIGIDTRQADLRGWDSLAHIRLVSGVESEFDFQFSLAEIEQINSVRQFVDAIGEHLR